MGTPELEKLTQALKGHDWYYGYSDDYGVYLAGQQSYQQLLMLAQKVPYEEARELWEDHAPPAFGFPLRQP